MAQEPIGTGLAVFDRLARVYHWVARRLRPDHHAIGALTSRADRTPAFYLLVAAAPARWPRRTPNGEFIEAARALLGVRLLHGVCDVPTHYDGTIARFREAGADEAYARQVTVRDSGYLELFWRLEALETLSGLHLSVDEMAQVLLGFGRLLQSDAYRRLIRGRFVARRKLDIRVFVTGYVIDPTGRNLEWAGLSTCVGDDPARASSQSMPTIPLGGYARQPLTSWPRRRQVSDFAETVLHDLYKQNGYLHSAELVDAIVSNAEDAAR
ncbi:MAG: hypothetical protein JO246_02000 [Frankiaceae bacterium]|nr:hypothetical protein [Frankiaceae bacterium]MBV9872641.1 hypothetical protein [Frankiaceae bacterium]